MNPKDEAPETGDKNGKAKSIGASVAIILATAAVLYWMHARRFEDTDDASIEGHVTAVSPNVSGTVTKVRAADNQDVRKGELLVEIDPRPFEVKLAQSRADVQAAEAEDFRAQADVKRYEELFKTDAVSRQTLDHAVAATKEAKARLELAKKRAAADELDLSYTRITAPVSGRIARKSVEEGAYVQTGQPLLALVPRDVWVVANFKETQLTNMVPGQTAWIKVDAYPGRTFTGRVDSIQSGTGSRFSLLPAENATGNYVKVVQRVPVKIVFDPPPEDGVLLAPGMSVVPEVEVK